MKASWLDPNSAAQAIYVPFEEDDPAAHPSACLVSSGTLAHVIASAMRMPMHQQSAVYVQVDGGEWLPLIELERLRNVPGA
jgi:hypothetical protein